MPRPVSDSIADGLPLWDTYEALFFSSREFLLESFLGSFFLLCGVHFEDVFENLINIDQACPPLGLSVVHRGRNICHLTLSEEGDESQADADVVTLFVSARYAVQENSSAKRQRCIYKFWALKK